MATEIFYYRDAQGSCAVQDFLDALSDKDRARSLAQIDLLEAPGELSAKMDREIEGSPVRVLSTHDGRTRSRLAYLRHGDQTILIDAVHGRFAKSQKRVLGESLVQVVSELQETHMLPADRLKSHREHVAEITLSDPTFAAIYSRARELTQFAAAVTRLRAASGFTTAALAERTGLSRTRVQSMERGYMPKLATMRRLVDALQARIIIAPGTGISIEPFTAPETKRSHKNRRTAAVEPTPELKMLDKK